MLDFSQVQFDKIAVHHVGNKTNEEGIILSNATLDLDETIEDLLAKYFLKPFKSVDFYNFTHEADIENNEVYKNVVNLFDNPDDFLDISQSFANRLFEKSVHPQVNGGEFYVVYFKECVLDDEIVDAIGMFKSENKDTYLKVYEKGENLDIQHEQGININKLDKGCLIFNTDKQHGFTVSIVDNVSGKGNEALYWKSDMLGLKQRADNYFQTNTELSVYKDFCDNVHKEDHDISKHEHVEMMNRAVDYFIEKETFKQEEFETEVISKPELIHSFRDYKADFQEQNEVQFVEQFDISETAVQKARTKMRSVIKLDRNFHVYVHGAADMIERTFDEEKGMKCYKLYFDKES